jgi:hypothetical protein
MHRSLLDDGGRFGQVVAGWILPALLLFALPLAPPTSPAHPVPDSLRTTIAFASPVEQGEPVVFTVRLTNPSADTVTVELTGREATADVVVREAGGGNGEAGEVVWRHLAGTALPMMLQRRPLAPGTTIERTVRWEQTTNEGAPVPPGPYTAEARLLSPEDDFTSPRKELVIRP